MGEGRNSNIDKATMGSKLNPHCNKISFVVFSCEHFRSEPYTSMAVIQRFEATV